jgi:hypothetical protein
MGGTYVVPGALECLVSEVASLCRWELEASAEVPEHLLFWWRRWSNLH